MLLRSVDCRVGLPKQAVAREGGDSNQVTKVSCGARRRSLAAQVVKGTAWRGTETPPPPFGRLRRFMNLITLSEILDAGCAEGLAWVGRPGSEAGSY